MRGAKEVLRNGRKALACAKGADSEYKEGTLPSGKTIDDYHRYIRECMYVKLRGSTGGENDDDDDDVLSTTADKDNQQHDLSLQSGAVVNPEEMPDDYCFSGMIAFFLWGFIVDDPQCALFQSKQFQIGDSARGDKGANSRQQVKKEAASAASIRRDNDCTLPGSPFRRGQSLNQQIEIAKLRTARSMEERRSIDNAFSTALINLQTDIDNRMQLAKLWGIKDRKDPIFQKIEELMDEKTKLSAKFANEQIIMDDRRKATDELIDDSLIGHHNSKRLKSSTSSTTTTAGFSTPASSRGVVMPTPISVSCAAGTSEKTGKDSPGDYEDDGKEPDEKELGPDDYYECTVDIRQRSQPPPTFVFAAHLNDNEEDSD